MEAEYVGAPGRPRGIEEWVEHLNRLMEDVKAWAEASGWVVHPTDMTAKEDGGCVRYEVPVQELIRGKAWVAVVPAARFAREDDGQLEFFPTRADGLVKFIQEPDYDPVAGIYLHEGLWFFDEDFHSGSTGDGRAKVIEIGRILLDEVSLNHVLDAIAAHS